MSDENTKAEMNPDPPFAAPTDSAVPDCCAEWTRSGMLNSAIEVIYPSGVMTHPALPFRFCPWCGRARLNDKMRHGGEHLNA